MISCSFALSAFTSRHVKLKPTEGLARLSTAVSCRSYFFDQLKAVQIRERTKRSSSSGGGSHGGTTLRLYGYEVLLETDHGMERVALSRFAVSPAVPRDTTVPMAIELARALDLPPPEIPPPGKHRKSFRERLMDRLRERRNS